MVIICFGLFAPLGVLGMLESLGRRRWGLAFCVVLVYLGASCDCDVMVVFSVCCVVGKLGVSHKGYQKFPGF